MWGVPGKEIVIGRLGISTAYHPAPVSLSEWTCASQRCTGDDTISVMHGMHCRAQLDKLVRFSLAGLSSSIEPDGTLIIPRPYSVPDWLNRLIFDCTSQDCPGLSR